VLKRPDSAFSLGVVKVDGEEQLQKHLKAMFAESELVIAQQYMRTDYDWRIGILDGRGLFACKYHMAAGHWQIAKHVEGKSTRWGKFETMPDRARPAQGDHDRPQGGRVDRRRAVRRRRQRVRQGTST
jgi:hypothetical protein